MAVFEQPRPAPFGAETVLKVVNVFETIMDSIRIKIASRRIFNSLNGLTAAQRADIGLAEKDLMSYARDMARRAL
jgi:hypothetical protein